MPFFDDTGASDDALRSPVWGAFGLLFDHLEQLVALNLVWALQIVPLLAALAFHAWPAWLRGLLALYSVVALAVATGTLYRLVALVSRGDALSVSVVRAELRAALQPTARSLVPLYALLLLLGWVATVVVVSPRLLALAVVLRLVFLLGLVCATYWGPLLAEQPARPPLWIIQRSALLAWRYPGQTMQTWLVAGLAAVIGVVSVGGLFLVAPVLVAVLQTRRFQQLTDRR